MIQRTISLISSLLDLKKEVPDFVGYEIVRTITVPLPDEMSDVIYEQVGHDHDARLMTITMLQVYNSSSKMQKNIRILYSGDYNFLPKMAFSKRNNNVAYTEIKESNEITIDEIPPENTLQMLLFNTTDDFEIEDVIVNGSKITTLMQWLAKAKMEPEYTSLVIQNKLLYFTTILLGITALCTVTFLFMTLYERNNTLDRLYDDLDSVKCKVYDLSKGMTDIDDLTADFDKLDIRSQYSNVILNKTTTFQEMKAKGLVILCPF